ncbi:MAG: VPLPA-CTERM-specific exosortase XrtD [Defluviimonas sp.]|nr:VPLPA-CTERM-specific exosortase XrtD [Defluviimonas sp.]
MTISPVLADVPSGRRLAGPLWFLLACLASLGFFYEGFDALLRAWSTPEYSHGPLIPVLSGLLFLRQLKSEPVWLGPVNRWPGVILLLVATAFGLLGKLSEIDEVTAYALILWAGAIILISFGWRQGKDHWPSVLHLVYMLPLPGLFYYKLSTFLQGASSELGVWFLQLLSVPVFLEGNIIDLGVLKLHVAEACSGLRYLFPILSFSYVFAVLYRGPLWHKAVLLISAAPITVLMNSVRIAIAGVIAERYGIEHVEGFQHFFEGWVIFLACVLILFILAWGMLKLQRKKMGLADALDLETEGLWTQVKRIRLVEPSKAMIFAALLLGGLATAWAAVPERGMVQAARDPFALFPRTLGDRRSDPPGRLDPSIARVLGADDYYMANFYPQDGRFDGRADRVELFMAYYQDQTRGGTHSPEICLPSAGWEIAMLERVDIAPKAGLDAPYWINRAIIQKGTSRMMGYYWFEQHGRHVAWDFAAKFWLLWDGFTIGRTDGGLVRILTPIGRGETEEQAEARLMDMFRQTVGVLPDYVPGL